MLSKNVRRGRPAVVGVAPTVHHRFVRKCFVLSSEPAGLVREWARDRLRLPMGRGG